MSPSSRPQHFTARAKLVERMRERLDAQSYPRLQMSLIVSLTGLAGLLASASLLKLGLHSMAWRYPAALLAEVALDGALVGSLYHRLRECERQHWLHAAWTHTRWPLLAMLLVVWLVGWGLGQAAPGAVTLGQAWAMT